MQMTSKTGTVGKRLHLHGSIQADELKRMMLANTQDIERARQILQKIGELLLHSIKRADNPIRGCQILYPVLLLRGGLTMYLPALTVFPGTPIGMIIPVRDESDLGIKVPYASLPSVTANSGYLIMDQLLASGATIRAALLSMVKNIGPEITNKISIAVPFASHIGIDRITKEFPDVSINAIWHMEELQANGRMKGPGFDIGDCSCSMVSKHRVTWSNPEF